MKQTKQRIDHLRWPVVFAIALGVCAFASHAIAAPLRVLAITPTPKGGPPLTPSKVLAAVTLAQKAGVHGDQLSNTWNQIESTPNQYDISDPQGGVSYLGDQLGWQLLYTISVIDTIARQVPPDLQNVAWDSSQMETRFHALINALMPVLSDPHLAYVSVGNEVDIYLSQSQQWAAYQNFYNDAVSYIHSRVPGLKVGVTVTYSGTTSSAATEQLVQSLNSVSDVFILTYYPLGPASVPNPPDVPLTDFPNMVQVANGLPVILQEVGYPSSKRLSSSPKQQAQFIDNVFTAWNGDAAQIPFLSFSQLHDMGNKWCTHLESYYGVFDPNFKAFICSIGLLKVGGAAKPAWKRFRNGAAALNASQAQ